MIKKLYDIELQYDQELTFSEFKTLQKVFPDLKFKEIDEADAERLPEVRYTVDVWEANTKYCDLQKLLELELDIPFKIVKLRKIRFGIDRAFDCLGKADLSFISNVEV
jgi:hypothetical protein